MPSGAPPKMKSSFKGVWGICPNKQGAALQSSIECGSLPKADLEIRRISNPNISFIGRRNFMFSAFLIRKALLAKE